MKRIISVFLIIVMLSGVLCLPALADDEYWKREDNLSVTQSFRNSDSYKVGDVNDDGTVNAKDSHELISYVVDCKTEINLSAADIDADGKATARDNFYFKASNAGVCSIGDFENGQRVYNFTIAGNDISGYSLVLPAETNYNDNVYFAYELLLKYIQKMTGVTLPKVYGDYDGKAIRFHCVPLESEQGQELGDDGYKYEVVDGNLEIYGATRGNMYAAYEIIEKYLGVLFCNTGFSFSEKLRSSDVPEGTKRSFNTPTKYRLVMHTFGSNPNAEYYAFARHLNSLVKSKSPESYYGYFIGSQKLNAHSFYYYQAMGQGEMPEEGTLNPDGTEMSLADRYYQKFLSGGGATMTDANTDQPCASTEGSYQLLFSGLIDTIKMLEADGRFLNFKRDRHMVSFSINDNDDYCGCTVCNGIKNGTKVKLRKPAWKTFIQEHYYGDYEITSEGSTEYAEFKKEGNTGLYMNMINRCADEIKEIYPEMQVFSILYEPDIPVSIRPRENMVLCYCSTISACAKCNFNDCENCVPIYTTEAHSLQVDKDSITEWGKICRETGAQLYTWYYPENYTFYLFDLPKFFDIYYDFKWMADAGIVGYMYEGTQSVGPEYTFCGLNAYLGSEMMWNPYMSYEEYIGLMKKYLKATYGKGYEHIYNYIVYMDEASKQPDSICCAYYYRAFDVYSKSYLDTHYEDMRNEIMAAIEENIDSHYTGTIENLLMECELLGLSAAYDRMYTNGNAESRKTYEERYTWLYNHIKDNGIQITSPDLRDSFKLPSIISFEKSPMLQIYKAEYRYGN